MALLSPEEIKNLLKMDEKAAAAWINAQTERFSFTAALDAAKELSKARAAANPSASASGLEQALGVGAGAGLGAGIAASRLTELVKGTTTTYVAYLRTSEIAKRLRTALGDGFEVRELSEYVSVKRFETMSIFCRVGVSNQGEKTTITVSGMNLTKTTQGADGVISGLMSLGKKALQGDDIVGNVLDTLGEAVDTAKEIGSDLWVANTIADVIEKYGSEEERAIRDAATRAVLMAEKAEQAKLEALKCKQCGGPHEDQQKCPNCGGDTGYVPGS